MCNPGAFKSGKTAQFAIGLAGAGCRNRQTSSAERTTYRVSRLEFGFGIISHLLFNVEWPQVETGS